jgi:hypothetical protein
MVKEKTPEIENNFFGGTLYCKKNFGGGTPCNVIIEYSPWVSLPFYGSRQRYFQGFGLVNLQNVLQLSSTRANIFISAEKTVTTGKEHVFTIPWKTFDSKPGRITITLVWTDPPASPAAGIALINVLDLVVDFMTPGLQGTILGNAYKSSTTTASDHINNVESYCHRYSKM